MKINWKIRLLNKNFWVGLIPAVLLLIQQLGNIFGYNFKIEFMSQSLLNLLNTIFLIFAILGIVTDPTTEGVSDSQRALEYDKPSK